MTEPIASNKEIMAICKPEWTDEEIANFNEYQESGQFHPYTCGCSSDTKLIAKKYGFCCPKCDYVQHWAWNWTVDGTCNKFHKIDANDLEE